MQFVLFIVLNAVMILRPEELFPAVAGVRFYLICFVLCAVASIPAVWDYFTSRPLRERPVAVCVLGFFAATILSRLGRMDLDGTLTCLEVFGKDIGYFLILVATISSSSRLVLFLRVLAVLFLGQISVALLNHHGFITFESIKLAPHTEYDLLTGATQSYNRMVGSGIYNDPNDLCLCIATTAVICCFNFVTVRNLLLRWLWLLPLPLLAHALTETYSRGGLLGLGVGVGAFLYARYGTTRMLPLLGLLVIGSLLVASGSRQLDFTIESRDTGNQRLKLWNEGLQAMSASPITFIMGIGYDRYAHEVNMVAHNSFVHCFVETGLVGGSLFTAAFVLAGWATYRAGNSEYARARRELRDLYPCILAVVLGYAAGCYSLSRQYVGPTYLVLSLASAYIDLALPPDHPWRRGSSLGTRIIVIGLLSFVLIRLMCYALTQY